MESKNKFVIPENILHQFGAVLKSFSKGETLFSEGSQALYYYQVRFGEIKMNNYNDDGKEFIQGIFSDGESFGEPPLLIDKKYSANAVSITDSEIFLLPKKHFFEMLKSYPEISIALNKRLAQRLYYKSIMASEISSQDPEHRILKLIDFLKFDVEEMQKSEKYCVQLTRQQLADLTGLRVETVIRSIKMLEKKGEIIIENRKVYR